MCVLRWHKHKNCDCQFATQIERCEDYKQKNANNVSDFIPTLFMKEFQNSTEFFRQRLDGIMYTTANSIIIIAAYLFPCPHPETVETGELVEVCPFCDDEDVQHKLEQLEKTRFPLLSKKRAGRRTREEGRARRSRDEANRDKSESSMLVVQLLRHW